MLDPPSKKYVVNIATLPYAVGQCTCVQVAMLQQELQMNPIDLGERRIALEVERLFRENPPRYGELCRNPVTDDLYVGMLDPVEPQKEAARRALNGTRAV
jgi:hypothetical protein